MLELSVEDVGNTHATVVPVQYPPLSKGAMASEKKQLKKARTSVSVCSCFVLTSDTNRPLATHTHTCTPPYCDHGSAPMPHPGPVRYSCHSSDLSMPPCLAPGEVTLQALTSSHCTHRAPTVPSCRVGITSPTAAPNPNPHLALCLCRPPSWASWASGRH